MKKIKEDDKCVYYEFSTGVASGSYLSPSGSIRYKTENVYGYCQFNKITEEFVLDGEKSNNYFLEKNNYEVKKVFFKLVYYKRNNLSFPDKIFIAIA